MTATTRVLLAAFLAVAAVDWAAVVRGRTRVRYAAKPGCVLLLIAAAAVLQPADEGARAAVLVALTLSLAGDVLLLPRRDGTAAPGGRFTAGLASFLLAHVAYVVAFTRLGVTAPALLVGGVAAAAVIALVGLPTVRAVRAGGERALAGPVAAYVVVISAMALAAVGTADPRAIAGAALFAGSDALIARERFIAPRPWMPLAIIASYHLAQALLVTAVP